MQINYGARRYKLWTMIFSLSVESNGYRCAKGAFVPDEKQRDDNDHGRNHTTYCRHLPVWKKTKQNVGLTEAIQKDNHTF